MFLEIAFLQQFVRYLHHPVFSAGVVIGSFLVFSGLGSHLASHKGAAGRAGMETVVAVIVFAELPFTPSPSASIGCFRKWTCRSA